MRLITFQREEKNEIGALAENDTKVVRLQAAEMLRAGQPHRHLESMLAFLQGGAAAREAAQAALEFARSQHPGGVVLDRAGLEILSPVPRPESIRDFMVFEQHVTNCIRKFEMPRAGSQVWTNPSIACSGATPLWPITGTAPGTSARSTTRETA